MAGDPDRAPEFRRVLAETGADPYQALNELARLLEITGADLCFDDLTDAGGCPSDSDLYHVITRQDVMYRGKAGHEGASKE